MRRQYRLGSLMHIKAGAHNFFQRLDEEVREFEAKHMKREGQGLFELPEREGDYFNPYSVGTDFSRQNLTSIDVRFWRLKSIPTL